MSEATSRPFDKAERIARQLERIGYTSIRTTGMNISDVSIDFQWPDQYPGLERREMANSIIVGGTGDLLHAVIRFPMFPSDEYTREEVRPLAVDVAREIGWDPDEVVRFNPTFDGITPHVDYHAPSSPRLTEDNVVETFRTAYQVFNERYGI